MNTTTPTTGTTGTTPAAGTTGTAPTAGTAGTAGTTAREGTVLAVTDETFAAEVLACELPVLVDFTAGWCPPCHMIAPVLAEIAAEESARLRIVSVDVDTNPATPAAYGVLSMPTLLLFRAGEPVQVLVGARPKRRLLQELSDAL